MSDTQPAIWAVVPQKPLALAKSRLSPFLPPQQRVALVISLLEHTLEILRDFSTLTGIILISADPSLSEYASRFGALFVIEEDTPGLNRSLDRARSQISTSDAQAMLIVPGDLPFLNEKSLLKVIHSLDKEVGVAIVPDKFKQGTNILLLSPPQVIAFRFGSKSFSRHCQAARKASTRLVIVEDDDLAWDIDNPQDLQLASSLPAFRF